MLEPIPFAGFVDIPDELTDQEILEIAKLNVDGFYSLEQLKLFARAVLKKAQEK
jgi:hypothetical protein